MKGPFATRRNAIRSTILIAGLAAVGLGFAGTSCTAAFLPHDNQPTQPATSSGPQPVSDQDITACSNRAGEWMSDFLNHDLAGDVWAERLTASMDPQAVQGLRGVDRDGLPVAHVSTVDAVIQGNDCWADVGLSDGQTVPVHVVSSGGRWVVSGWGQ